MFNTNMLKIAAVGVLYHVLDLTEVKVWIEAFELYEKNILAKKTLYVLLLLLLYNSFHQGKISGELINVAYCQVELITVFHCFSFNLFSFLKVFHPTDHFSTWTSIL